MWQQVQAQLWLATGVLPHMGGAMLSHCVCLRAHCSLLALHSLAGSFALKPDRMHTQKNISHRLVRQLTPHTILLGILACTPLFYPTSKDVERARHLWHDADSLQLVTGRQLYIDRCGTCHYLYRPHQFTPEEWKHNIDEYADEAKLTPQEKQLILRYLITMSMVDPRQRKQQLTSKP